MAQWGPFVAVAVVLTILLLVLARNSQQLLRKEAATQPDDDPDSTGVPERRTAGRPPAKSSVSTDTEAIPDSVEELEDDAGTAVGENAETPESEQGTDLELTAGMLLANVAVTQGLVVVLLLGAAWRFSIPASAVGVDPDSLRPGTRVLGLGVAFGLVLWLGNELSATVADAVGAAYDEHVRELLSPDSAGGWVVLLVGVLPVIAVAEEMLFRAALIGVPAAGFDVSPWVLALVSSLAFALGHGAQGRVGIVVTGTLGLLLAAGYILSGSLVLVIVAHYVVNGLEFLVHEYLELEVPFPPLVAPTE